MEYIDRRADLARVEDGVRHRFFAAFRAQLLVYLKKLFALVH